MSPKIPLWAKVLAGLIATVGLVWIGLAARSDRREWIGFAILLAVLVPAIVWTTVSQFTSATPVFETWDAHIRLFAGGGFFLFLGLICVLGVGDGGTLAVRLLIGVPLLLLGCVVLAAERRDFRRWRAAARNPRFD